MGASTISVSSRAAHAYPRRVSSRQPVAIATAASWTAKGLLFLIALPFAAGNFHAPSSSGDRQTAVWVVLAVILAAGIAIALITLVPRLRRLASSRVRPHLVNIWANVKTIATEPRKIAYILTGSVLAQLLVASALGASLHAVGQQASIATILVVITLASIIGEPSRCLAASASWRRA